jgi:hypothetical protein
MRSKEECPKSETRSRGGKRRSGKCGHLSDAGQRSDLRSSIGRRWSSWREFRVILKYRSF